MAAEWQQLTLGDLIDENKAFIQTGPFGSQLHASDYTANGIKVIPTEAIGKGRILGIEFPEIKLEKATELKRHSLRSGDILFARRGIQATGLSALVDEKYEGAICGTGAILLRVLSKDIDPVFLSLYLNSNKIFSWLRANAVGAVMPNLNATVLRSIPLRLPHIDEQKNIANFLTSIDNKLDVNRKMNATLGQIAQALFKSWFIDFDPVKEKASGRQPKGLDTEIVVLFPSEFQESKLGPIPNGWDVVALDDLFDVVGGGTPKTSNPDYWNGHIPWFSVVDAPLESDIFVIDTEKKITAEGLSNSSKRVLRTGTTIISARGTVGKLAVAAQPMTMNQSCYGLDGKYGDFFTYYSVKRAVSLLRKHTHGAVFDTITRGTFNSIDTILPSRHLCSLFEDEVSSLMRIIENNLRESQTLSSIRDSVLPELISGRLCLPDAEKSEGGAL